MSKFKAAPTMKVFDIADSTLAVKTPDTLKSRRSGKQSADRNGAPDGKSKLSINVGTYHRKLIELMAEQRSEQSGEVVSLTSVVEEAIAALLERDLTKKK